MFSPAVPIVVADTGPAVEVVRGTLSGSSIPLVGVDSLARAKSAIVAETPLVLCGCNFDDGRMYDLLRYIKSRPALSGIPFLAIRAQAGELDDAMYESVKIATGALGGNGFVDLFRWQRLYGPAQAAKQFAQQVQGMARVNGRV